MSSEEDAPELPEHADHDPGAEVKVTRREDGGVRVDFSDGSDSMEVSRREFMRISGVAAASATMTGASCRYPKEEIVPYLDRQEESEPGEATYYSSVCNGCSAQCGIVVETRSGRPIKLEGNEDHPVNEGGLCARGESSYRRLYDPDRAETPLAIRDDGNHQELSWEKLDQTVRSTLEQIGSGGTVRILTRNQPGSARDQLFDEIAENHPNAEHYVWEPLTAEALLEASNTSYGSRHAPVYHFDRADMVVSLGSDFLGTWMSPIEFTKKFVQKREVDDANPNRTELNRFIAFEGAMTTTGANADEHHTVQPSRLAHVALGLAHDVIVNREHGDLAEDRAVRNALQPFDPESVAEATGIEAATIESYAAELVEHAGDGLVVAGAAASNSTTGLALEAAVNLLNAALGNEGTTVERSRVSRQDEGSFSDLQSLAEEMNDGEVDVLIVDGSNPVYATPPDLEFEEGLEQVGTVISTADRVDETAAQADYLAPGSHYLESWGDTNPIEGVHSLQQPTIQPLYGTRSTEASLITWFGESGLVPSFKTKYLETAPERPDDQQVREEKTIGKRGANVPYDAGPWYRYLRDHWKSEIYPRSGEAIPFDDFWNAVLRKGVWEADDAGDDRPSFRAEATVALLPDGLPDSGPADPSSLESLELHAVPTVALYDGRTANNGHLQEMPDPVTKITWGAYAAVSPRTFVQNDLSEGDILEVTVEAGGEKTTKSFPAFMQPGMADGVVAVPLGYGRTHTGVVGNDVGENAYELSRVSDGVHAFAGLDATVSKTPDQEEVAKVQGSSVIDLDQRPLLATATEEAYEADPSAGVGAHEPEEMLWDAHDYGEQSGDNPEDRGEMALKWGMSIDMTKCTGCSACITACQEENNVPVVGKKGVSEGREMHWMRLDRYFLLPTPGEDEVVDELRNDLDDDPMMGGDPSIEFARQYYDKEGELPESLADPQAVNQPMLCQHCERAPCETVCPVAATTHSSDGLNQMAYNRCVGTRYCANNCPYKVRRFNWFNYSRDRGDGIMSRITPELEEHGRLNVEEPLPMGLNPDVTVRSRGVMEKCTFCVQRIRRAKWQLREENRDEYREDDVVTACESACPADAIEFGNIHESSDHQVRKDHESPRTTRALAHLNTSPSVAYLTDVRNTDDLPGAYGHGDEVGGGHGSSDGGHGASGGDHESSGHGEGNSKGGHDGSGSTDGHGSSGDHGGGESH